MATALVAEPVGARDRQHVSYSGLGTYEPVAGGIAVAGSGTGAPFDGTFTGLLQPVDGTLPAPGDCEAATATLRLDGSGRRSILLENGEPGTLCGQWTDTVNRVTHVYTGRYEITDASPRRSIGTDGWYEIRLADNGVASVTAVDT